MRWLPALLALVALPLGSLAAKSPATTDKFETFHSQSLSTAPLPLADASFKKLTAAPRDYSVAVLFTAMNARYGCQLCNMFQPEWEILAKSWVRGDKEAESRLIFGTLDFADGREIFLSFGLQTAPVLFLFQPTIGPHASASSEPVRLDFTGSELTAEAIHDWLSRHLPDRPHPAVYRPIDYVGWAVKIVAVLGMLSLVYKLSPYLIPFFTSRKVWAGVSLISIVMFSSGHMFNQIRKVPYVAGDGRGGISYFAGGFQNQYGLETQIIGGIYGILAFATIAIGMKAPTLKTPAVQQLVVLGWGITMIIMYSMLISLFRDKNGGYPFKFPPFM